MADTDQRHRVVVLGTGKVGKTCILRRFLFNTYNEDYKETVEDLYCRDYNVRGSCMKVIKTIKMIKQIIKPIQQAMREGRSKEMHWLP